MQHEDGWRGSWMWAREKFGARDVVPLKFRLNRTAPSHRSPGWLRDRTGKIDIVRGGVILAWCKPLALDHVAFHRFRAVTVQSMTRLQQIHRRAHAEIDGQGSCAAEDSVFRVRLHALARRVRKIVRRQLKFLAQLRVDSLESSGQFRYNAPARE